MTALTKRLLRRYAPAPPRIPGGEVWRLRTQDGVPIVARLFRGSAPERVVVIYSATSCPKTLYESFARWLVERNWAVVTFDYRGIGESASRETLGPDTGFAQWAQDGQAVIAAAAQAHPGLPVVGLGHSIGGSLAAACTHGSLRGLLTLGAQQCYWRDWPALYRPLFAGMWMVGFPIAARLRGYVPGRWFGMPEDVPAGVAREWARACRQAESPDTAATKAAGGTHWSRAENFAHPVVAYAIADDPIGTPQAVRRLHARFRAAAVQLRIHHPDAPMGHFGAFARRGQSLWPELEAALRELSGAGTAAQLEQP